MIRKPLKEASIKKQNWRNLVLMALFGLLALALGPSELLAAQIGGVGSGFNEADTIYTIVKWGGGWVRLGRLVLVLVAIGLAFWQAIGLLQGKKNGAKIGVLIGCIVSAFILTMPKTAMRLVGLGKFTCMADVVLKSNVSQSDVSNCLRNIEEYERN